MSFQHKSDISAPGRVPPQALSRPPRACGRARLAAAASVGVAAALALSTAGAGTASASTGAHPSRAGTGASLGVGLADPDLVTETPAVQASQLAEMKAIGITSIRMDARWDLVQPDGPGTSDWANLDQAVRSVRAAGMSVDLIIDGCPQWAALPGTGGDASPQPASPAQYAAFAAQVAARYAPEGVGMFEIWNEPNNVVFWQPKPNPAAYTADLVAAYRAIKAADPAAFVISGGLAPAVTDGTNISPVNFLQDMYADGAKGSFDAVGYHPYSYPALPDTYESWSGWSQMNQTSPSIRSVMASNGDSGTPVWITEVGAPSGGPGGIGQAGQQNDLTQVITDARRNSWIGGLYLYTWMDDGTDTTNTEDWFGLLNYGGSPKPAYFAVAAAVMPWPSHQLDALPAVSQARRIRS